jgi:hypothetical protein
MYDNTILGETVSTIHRPTQLTVMGISNDISGCRRYVCKPCDDITSEEVSLYAGEIERAGYASNAVDDVESTNTELETELECGFEVRDKLSGFTGTISTVLFRLFNGVRVCVTQYEQCDNSKPTSTWIDGSRVEILDKEKPDYVIPDSDDDDSGCISPCSTPMAKDVEMN